MTATSDRVQVIEAEFDEEGVYFYQAYNDAIATWAVGHQRLGGPLWSLDRMTWIKPSFAWVLYRSGYASKHNQTRVLKIKLPHAAVAELLSGCSCGHGGGGTSGRVQWDPARDLLAAEGKVPEPRKMLRRRAIQIGLKGRLREVFVQEMLSIEDVTALARQVGEAHASKECAEAMARLAPLLPEERPYQPQCDEEVLTRLGLAPGEVASQVAQLGFGKAKVQ